AKVQGSRAAHVVAQKHGDVAKGQVISARELEVRIRSSASGVVIHVAEGLCHRTSWVPPNGEAERPHGGASHHNNHVTRSRSVGEAPEQTTRPRQLKAQELGKASHR